MASSQLLYPLRIPFRANLQPTRCRPSRENNDQWLDKFGGLVGYDAGIGVGIIGRIGGLAMGTSWRVTIATNLGFSHVHNLNTQSATLGIFWRHHTCGRRTPGVHFIFAIGWEVIVGGSRRRKRA